MSEKPLFSSASIESLAEMAENDPFVTACLRQIVLPMTYLGHSESDIAIELGIDRRYVRSALNALRRELTERGIA